MRVLHLINSANYGGSEVYIHMCIKKLVENGDKVFLIYNNAGPLVSIINELGVVSEKVEMKHPFDIKAIFRIRRFLTENKIDAIHTHFLRENHIAVLASLGTKVRSVLWTYHTIKQYPKYVHLINRFITRFNKNVIAVCNFATQSLMDIGVNKNKITVIHNGVDLKRYSEVGISQHLYHEFSINSSQVVFAIVARLEKIKGHEYLFESIREIKNQTTKPFKCLVVGDGSRREYLQDLARKYELEQYLLFIGNRSDVPQILNIVDFTVLTSSSEVFPFAVLESFAAGRCAIATNVGGVSELVIHKRTGLLVEHADVTNLSRCLMELITNKSFREELNHNAVEYVRNNFSIDQMLTRTFSLY